MAEAKNMVSFVDLPDDDVEGGKWGPAALRRPSTITQSKRDLVLGDNLSPQQKIEEMKRYYDKDGNGVFDEDEVDRMMNHLMVEIEGAENLQSQISRLMMKLTKNRRFSAIAIVGMGLITILASIAGLVAVEKSVYRSEVKVEGAIAENQGKVQGAIAESAFADTHVDDKGVVHLTDKAGKDVTTRSTGDVFHASIVLDTRTGRQLTCVRVLDVAQMAGSVASGADMRLAVDDNLGLETEVLSLAGDFKDSGEALHFGGGKAHIHLGDDSCNVALQANALGKVEVQDKAPPLEDNAVETGAADNASPEDDVEVAEEDNNSSPFGLRSLVVEDVLTRHREIYMAGRAAFNNPRGLVNEADRQRLLQGGGKSVPVYSHYFCAVETDCDAGHECPGYGRQCVDINECKTTHDCHVGASCVNNKGSFTCPCGDGWQATNSQGHGAGGCANINECDTTNECDNNADCTDTDGSYLCTCQQGFQDVNGDGTYCSVNLQSASPSPSVSYPGN